jgi:hypothetical protein
VVGYFLPQFWQEKIALLKYVNENGGFAGKVFLSIKLSPPASA